MLSSIIPSKARRKILGLFFQHSAESHYLREIVRTVSEEVNAVKRELDILSDAKVLLKERRLNKVFYSLNKQYRLYDEFLRIFAKESAFAQNIYDQLPKFGKVKFIAISTKFAKHQELKDDDVALVFVGTLVVPEVSAMIATAEKERGAEINYTVMTEDEFAFRKKNNDPFIWKFLRQPKILLSGSEEEFMK